MSTLPIQKSGDDLAALKLYYLPISAHSRRVTIYLGEKGIDLQLQEIDGANYAHKSPEFLAINPAGKSTPRCGSSGNISATGRSWPETCRRSLIARCLPCWTPLATCSICGSTGKPWN